MWPFQTNHIVELKELRSSYDYIIVGAFSFSGSQTSLFSNSSPKVPVQQVAYWPIVSVKTQKSRSYYWKEGKLHSAGTLEYLCSLLISKQTAPVAGNFLRSHRNNWIANRPRLSLEMLSEVLQE